ncbi:MAG: VWA domain-containing protein [Candidatus Omnitrophica bacterium]|nr:VWA domain-containing protein [Candidatus Omnitrophota bacterium]
MEWGLTENFIWLWIVPLAGVIFFVASFRKRAKIGRFGEIALIQKLITSYDPRKRVLKRTFFILALLFAVLALCQPHFRKKEVLMERRGVDVVIALDVSNSMLVKDITPNRLEKAKLELAGLIDRLKEDRIGIVAFAGDAFIQCPLTFDKTAAKLFLSMVSPNIIPMPGTAIADAMDTAVEAFGGTGKEEKAIILLTDGEDHEGNVVEAAKRAKKAGARIFTIGVGTPDGGALPGKPVVSKLDESVLKEIARLTGGTYHRSTRGELETESIVRTIREMAQKGFGKERFMEYEESFQWLLVIAYLLLLTEMLISERRKEI